MTREEAKNEWVARAYNLEGYRFDEIIDGIYDYFESRTCVNCKYLSDIYCKNETNDNMMDEFQQLTGYIRVAKNFSCNRWEQK